MKKTIVLTLLATTLLVLAVNKLNAQTPIASYPFNGNANDASGNGNNGIVNGATLTTDRFGNANSAYNFDGVDDFIQVANSPSLQLGATPFTMMAWVKPNGYFAGSCQSNFILSKGQSSSLEGTYHLQYGDFLDGNCGVLTPSVENFAASFRRGSTDFDAYTNPASVPVLGNWYMVVGTYDGTNLRLYVNGVLKATQPVSGTLGALNTTDLFIGRASNLNTYFVNGVIDDVKLYSTALTDAQIFDAYVNDLKKPGSGNALSFNGPSNHRIEVPDNEAWNLGSGDFAIEGWINPSVLTGAPTIITQSVAGAGTNQSSFFIGLNYNGTGSLDMYSTTDVGWTHGISSSAGIITTNKWHHFTVTRTGGTPAIYINGILQTLVQAPFSGSFGIASPMFNGTENLTVAMQTSNSNNNFTGIIDEIRIFKGVGLTQSQVRDWMCKKINSSHPVYNNLVGYFRFDEGSTNVTGGYNGNFGTLVNSPSWQTSGAALGDASVHDYVNATKTANISHSSGENFSVTSTSGSPDGIHVYRVDEQPNTVTGATGAGANNKYFGVFQIGGTTPQYTAIYNYNGNPYVNPGNESTLRLFKRNDNAVTTWSSIASIPNEPANTITVTGESTEYILGSLGTPLPVTLLNFAASPCNDKVCLLWTIENETIFSHYEVEKSQQGTNFNRIGTINARSANGRTSYTATDSNPFAGDNFYRLKMVNLDGSYTYSNIIRVNLGQVNDITLQPNPAREFVIIKGTAGYQQLMVTDLTGRILLQKNIQAPLEEINLQAFSPGMYFIRLIKDGKTTSLKLVKQ